jgi:hypothetical protein
VEDHAVRPVLFVAPLAILLLDVVPQSTVRDSSGASYRLSVGASIGRYEEQHFDCDGNLIDAIPVVVRSGGVRFDMLGEQGRLSAFGGVIASQPGKGHHMDGIGVESSLDDQYGGFFGGMQVAAEWRPIGLGLGVAAVQGDAGHEDLIAPSVYLRYGPLDEPHFRLDVFAPSETFGNTPGVRAGIGYDQSARDGVRLFIGAGSWPYMSGERFEPRLAAECDVPMSSDMDLLLRAQAGIGAEAMQGSLGAGVAFRFSEPR